MRYSKTAEKEANTIRAIDLIALVVFGLLAVSLFTADIAYSQSKETAQTVHVIPGQGIRDELELGMTIDDLTNRRSDVILKTNVSGYYATIPKIGASVHVTNKLAPITLINFDIDPTIATNCFYGFVGSVLFQRGQSVNRQSIYKVFGDLSNHKTSDPKLVKARILNRANVAWLSDDIETLYYPKRGIMFTLRRGVVIRFGVMK